MKDRSMPRAEPLAGRLPGSFTPVQGFPSDPAVEHGGPEDAGGDRHRYADPSGVPAASRLSRRSSRRSRSAESRQGRSPMRG